MSPVIDRVILTYDGKSQTLTTKEFMDLELSLRIRHVMAGDVTFYSGKDLVPQSEALRALQSQNSKSESRR